MIKYKLTNLHGNWLLQNDWMNSFCEMISVFLPCLPTAITACLSFCAIPPLPPANPSHFVFELGPGGPIPGVCDLMLVWVVHVGHGVMASPARCGRVEVHGCVTEAGSVLRLIYSCITQLKAQGPSRTCNESKEQEEEEASPVKFCKGFGGGVRSLVSLFPLPALSVGLV